MKSNGVLKKAASKVGFKFIMIGGIALIIGGWVADARAEGVPKANRELAKGLMSSSPQPTLMAISTLIELYEALDKAAEDEIKRNQARPSASGLVSKG